MYVTTPMVQSCFERILYCQINYNFKVSNSFVYNNELNRDNSCVTNQIHKIMLPRDTATLPVIKKSQLETSNLILQIKLRKCHTMQVFNAS